MDRAVTLCVQSADRMRLLRALTAKDVTVFDLARQNGAEYKFCVNQKDARKTFAILSELCYTYSVASDRRFAARAKIGLRRLGFLVTTVVLIACMLLLRTFVWRVEITGCDGETQEKVEHVLRECGVYAGSRLARVDEAEAAAAVRGIAGVKAATVTRTGTCVRAQVYQSEPVSPPLADGDTDVVASFDATVTRLVVRQGTALVKVGQNVAQGTPLIGAFREGQEGERIPSKASGLVYGTVTHTQSFVCAETRTEQVPASTHTRTRLALWGLGIGKNPVLESGSRVRVTEQKLNVFLPLRVQRITVVRYESRLVTEPIEAQAARLEKTVLGEFVSKLSASQPTVRHTVREIGGGQYRVDVFVSCEAVIGGV